MREPPAEWEWRLGTQPLTEIWDMGYRELRDVQMPFRAGDVKDFVKELKRTDHKIEMRQKRLDMMAKKLAAKPDSEEAAKPAEDVAMPPVEPPPKPTDEILIELEESKHRTAWVALRAAREVHLQHFGKIGTGDIELLLKEIENESENGKQVPASSTSTDAGDVGSGSPMTNPRTVGEDGDIKMRDR
ncbi:hypothetical protein MIND_00519400 [Mycena indigotica]|nr:uncharacterized protein MIND_00519400 [Mycena indigotica]KAF7307257.1 hypothetical protein MIND_00519400 [Mycena indigotica]